MVLANFARRLISELGVVDVSVFLAGWLSCVALSDHGPRLMVLAGDWHMGGCMCQGPCFLAGDRHTGGCGSKACCARAGRPTKVLEKILSHGHGCNLNHV